MELPADDGTLQAALAFVDEFYVTQGNGEGASDAATVVEATSEPETAGTSAPTAQMQALEVHDGASNPSTGLTGEGSTVGGSKPKRKRKARREELIYLRATVQALENKLQELTQEKDAEAMEAASDTSEPSSDEVQVDVASLWRAIAGRQKARRCESEEMNQSLRALLQEQLQVASSLENMLSNDDSNRLSTESKPLSISFVSNVKPMRVHNTKHPLANPTIFAEFKSTLNSMHEQTDSIFADPRLAVDALPHRVVELRVGDGSTAPAVEALDTRIIPFSFQVTMDAQWQSLLNSNGRLSKPPLDPSDPDNNDTIIVTFEGEIEFPLATVQCTAKAGIRRIVEPGRIVILTCMIMDPVSTSNCDTALNGMFVRHHVWHELRPDPQLKVTGKEATLSRLYQVASPEGHCADGNIGYQHTVGALTDFVLNTIGFQLDFRYQCLENRLFDMASD